MRAETAIDVELKSALADLDLIGLNHALYRCEREEESTEYGGDGAYDIPDCGRLTYAGIAGAAVPFESIRAPDDLAHPVCAHLRAGNWILDWSVDRLQREAITKSLGDALKPIVGAISKLPSALKPARAAQFFTWIRAMLEARALECMSTFARSSPLTRVLSISSIQYFGADARSSGGEASGRSVSAGLPHFSHGWMRTWGRDTFIALRGLFLVTGRFGDAKQIIIDFARTVRHGLIPNLYDQGRSPRSVDAFASFTKPYF